MNSPVKIGAISGLVAGFLAGIVFNISVRTGNSIGLYESRFPLLLIAQDAYGANIVTGIIFGVICGVIYSRIYSVIPGKGVSKGFFFGLILLLISWIRQATWSLAYGYYHGAAGFIFDGFFQWAAYGLVLGFLYDFLRSRYYPAREEPKIITYDMKSGLLPGAIAGIAQGLTASIANLISFITRLFGPQAMPGAPEKFILDFWISQSGSHIVLNIIWGIVFGLMLPKVYSLVPGKGITKGLCYSFVIFLTSSFLAATYWIAWGALSTAVWQDFIAFFAFLAFGLVLGALYKK